MQCSVESGVTIVMPIYQEGESTVRQVEQALESGARVVAAIGLDEGAAEQADTSWQALAAFAGNPRFKRLCLSPPGRAVQMNYGAKAASSETEVLLFLHADTRLPADFSALLRRALAPNGETQKKWGRFDVRFDVDEFQFRLLAFMMNGRSALSGMCTGDQAMFMSRTAFDAVGGFPEQPLMEDIEISKHLRRLSRPLRIKTPVTTSARRWQQDGWLRTVLLMWAMRVLYFFGVSPGRLLSWYRHAR